MTQYIAYVNRKKLASEESLVDHYRAITLGVVEGANIDKAFKAAQVQFKSHPERLFINVVLFKKASPIQQKIAFHCYAVAEWHCSR